MFQMYPNQAPNDNFQSLEHDQSKNKHAMNVKTQANFMTD